jgi:phage terminase Nu1 subunit (DNA packaging protein)
MKFRTLKLPEVAKLLSSSDKHHISERWINRLSKEKGFPRKARGDYDLLACVHWYIEYLFTRIDGSKHNNDSLQHSEERKARAQVELLEIKLAQIKGELIPITQIIGQIEPIFGAIKQQLISIPKAAAREFNSKELETFLDPFIRKSLTELATLDTIDWSGAGAEEQAEDLARTIHEAGA